MVKYKIIFKEWMDNKRTLNIHCKTFEQLKEIYTLLNKYGKKQITGLPYNEKGAENAWKYYGKDIILNNKGELGVITYAKRTGAPVYEFEEVYFSDASTIANWFD